MYQCTNGPEVLRVADGTFIPPASDNGDYAAVLAWLAAGNTLLPVPPATEEEQAEEKKGLLTVARAQREMVLGRLLGHRRDCEDWLTEANALLATEQAKPVPNPGVVAAQQARIVLETNNLAAIAACRLSLKNMMADQRIVDSVDGEAKAAVIAVWLEIVAALWLAAPTVVVAFKELDAL